MEALNDNKSFLTPKVGVDKLKKDPCIIQGTDGEIHRLEPFAGSKRGIAYAHSKDLKNWEDISGKAKFPEGTRHRTVFIVNA